MANGRRDQRQQQQDPILTRIEGVNSFSEIKTSEFALPDGFAQQIARSERKMKTTQLRKFFSKIKNIENKVHRDKQLNDDIMKDLYLIVPELTYALGRELITRNFFRIITTIIKDKIKSVDDFDNFSRFMTALVAYRKVEE